MPERAGAESGGLEEEEAGEGCLWHVGFREGEEKVLEKVDEKKAPRLEGGSEKEKEKEVEQTLELSEGEAEDDKDGGAAGNGQLHDVGEVAEQVLHEFALPRPKESDLDSVDDGMGHPVHGRCRAGTGQVFRPSTNQNGANSVSGWR